MTEAHVESPCWKVQHMDHQFSIPTNKLCW